MQCVYCTAANLGRQHANGAVETVLEEVERTVAGARERGVGRVPIFFADDEFNLPEERHAIAVLEGLRDRGLTKHISWRAYFNPTPFSAEFAELVRETNGHVSITVDSAADALLETAQKPFRRRHLDALVALLGEHGVSADLGLIFGLPGETEETIAETIGFVRSLPESIEVVYSAGARVYPHTPLARIAEQEPDRLVGADDPTFLSPVVYSRPWPPRELARRLDEQLRELPNVSRVGVAYATGLTTLSDAYRAVLSKPTLQQTVTKSNGRLPGTRSSSERRTTTRSGSRPRRSPPVSRSRSGTGATTSRHPRQPGCSAKRSRRRCRERSSASPAWRTAASRWRIALSLRCGAENSAERLAEELVLLGRADRHADRARCAEASGRADDHAFAQELLEERPRVLADLGEQEVRRRTTAGRDRAHA